jgi:hypothetical protein
VIDCADLINKIEIDWHLFAEVLKWCDIHGAMMSLSFVQSYIALSF